MYLLTIIIVILINTFIVVEAKNILAVLPVPSKSHHYMFQPIIKELAYRGYNVTLVTPYSLGENLTNVEEIILETSFAQTFIEEINFDTLFQIGKAPIISPPRMSFWFFGKILTEECLNNAEVQSLIHSKERSYDVILLEVFFGQESFMGFSDRFKAPVVSLISTINYLFSDEFVGNPLGLSYVPHQELPISSPMSFYDRLINVLRSVLILFTGYNRYLPEQEAIMKKYFNHTSSENIPTLVDMLRHNISLTLVNSHPGLDYIRPLMPNVIGVAGLHIKNKTKPLPKDIQTFLDTATDGVIYFSLGTIVPPQRMPPELKNVFVKVFSRLKQKILWKANVDTMDDLSRNVKVVKWAPQQSILAHKNIKSFITHGGLLSQQEAVYFGIPEVILPVFADQHMNAARAEAFGFGIKLDLQYLTEEKLAWAINEVVNNKKYKETVETYSKIVRDKPIPGIENAAYWIEYVIRHKGAPHLRNSAKENLNYFQYLLLDVILFIIIVFLLCMYLVYFCMKLIIVKYARYISAKYLNKNKSE